MDNIALRSLSEYFSKALSSNLISLQSENLPKILDLFSKLLNNFDQEFVIKVKPLGQVCLHCGKYIHHKEFPKAINLRCSDLHYFCSNECIKRHSLMSTNATLLDLKYVRCPACFTSIEKEIINKAFDGRLESLQADACDRALKSLLDDESKAKMFQSKFTCQICFMEIDVEQGITLNCDHRFCSECMRQHISLLIDSKLFKDC